MHLKFEKRYITYLLFGMLALLFVFCAGVMIDVMKPAGGGWQRLQLDQTIAHPESAPGEHHH